ncbi:hypothetical protein MSMTP_1284 [Methanosarcina sp. MTP4]|nr:hypothetical protein MSMTP_1284 [Methanosarcina sp. MTP4]
MFIILFSLLALSAGVANEDSYLRFTSSGNAFGREDILIIDEDIEGDLVLGGSLLEVNSNIGDDLIAGGGLIYVNGNVSGNVLASGARVRVKGNVGGDLMAVGGEVFLSEDSTVEGDAFLTGGMVALEGVINGDSSISAYTLRTGKNFKLKGDLELNATNTPHDLKENVDGSPNVTEWEITDVILEKASEGIGFFGFILGLLSSLALGLVLIFLFQDFVVELEKTVWKFKLKAGFWGLGMLIFISILSLGLFITILGWSLLMLLALLTALALLVATVPVKLVAGKVIYNLVFENEDEEWVYYLIGAVIFAIVYEIPYLGELVHFVVLLIGFGAIGIWFEDYSKFGKP